MACTPDFIDYLCTQLSGAGDVSARKMFGEYGVYCNGKLIGLACDNQFFLKPTNAARELLENPVEAPPYPGAKPSFRMDCLDDPEFLARVVQAGWPELPEKKSKTKK